jgi:hypothetical protein
MGLKWPSDDGVALVAPLRHAAVEVRHVVTLGGEELAGLRAPAAAAADRDHRPVPIELERAGRQLAERDVDAAGDSPLGELGGLSDVQDDGVGPKGQLGGVNWGIWGVIECSWCRGSVRRG